MIDPIEHSRHSAVMWYLANYMPASLNIYANKQLYNIIYMHDIEISILIISKTPTCIYLHLCQRYDA